MLTTHYFYENGEYSGSASIGALETPNNGYAVKSKIEIYPWPIRLEEGVIVQDVDKMPFEGKWRTSGEVKKLKAKREKSNNGKSK